MRSASGSVVEGIEQYVTARFESVRAVAASITLSNRNNGAGTPDLRAFNFCLATRPIPPEPVDEAAVEATGVGGGEAPAGGGTR